VLTYFAGCPRDAVKKLDAKIKMGVVVGVGVVGVVLVVVVTRHGGEATFAEAATKSKTQKTQ